MTGPSELAQAAACAVRRVSSDSPTVPFPETIGDAYFWFDFPAPGDVSVARAWRDWHADPVAHPEARWVLTVERDGGAVHFDFGMLAASEARLRLALRVGRSYRALQEAARALRDEDHMRRRPTGWPSCAGCSARDAIAEALGLDWAVDDDGQWK